jgi:hypothetical protein
LNPERIGAVAENFEVGSQSQAAQELLKFAVSYIGRIHRFLGGAYAGEKY